MSSETQILAANAVTTAPANTTTSTTSLSGRFRPFYTLYLDIETYSPDGINADALVLSVGTLLETTGGRSPYHRMKIFSSFYPTTAPGDISSIVQNERKALAAFYTYYTKILDEARRNNAILHVVGWNIINYDLPLLYHRLYDYSIDESDRLFLNLFHYPHVVDLRQIYIFLNQFRLTGSSMSALLRHVYNVERNSSGADIAEFVRAANWSAIDDHLTADLVTISRIHKDLKALARSPAVVATVSAELPRIAEQSRPFIEAAHHISELRPMLGNRNG